MKRSLILLLIALAGPALLLGRAPDKEEDAAIAGDDDLVAGVKKSIDRGVAWLRKQQEPNGSWGERDSYPGGRSALALLALLNAGVKPDDPAIKKGLEFLRERNPQHTYVVGLQTMVFCLVGDKADKERIERNVKWLEDTMYDDGWSYSRGDKNRDNSNSQYAMLGLHEAALAGYAVSTKTLERVKKIYKDSQVKGGWGYQAGKSSAPWFTMTTAGLCNLLIARMDLARGKGKLDKDGVDSECGEYDDNGTVASAIAWLGDNFPGRGDFDTADMRAPHYALYGIERAGRVSGQRFFGGHDWYELGCRWLISGQKADGFWRGTRGFEEQTPTVATSFALLFLSKGRTPVLISKMAYGDPAKLDWNNKRSDVKHLTEFCSKAIFKNMPLAWQNYDIRAIDAGTEAAQRKLAAQLLQSPIVYFNGHHRAPRGKEAGVLKEYLANGGFLIAENCCGKKKHPAFDKDFRRLMADIFPPGTKLEPLEAEHPLWLASGKYASSPKDFPLEGIKQGCKTVVVYSPVPLAGWWEANLHEDKGTGQKAFELGANIVAYATGLEAPKPRLTRVEVASDKKEPPKRGFLQVGQLKHDGDWQPAPKAMRNLMAEARKTGLDVLLKPEPVFPSDEAVADFKFLYMHGRKKFEAKRGDLKSLRFALRSGSMLLADACCGATEFDGSFRAFVEELFGDDKLKLEPVPADDRLYSAKLNGEEIKTVRRREGKERKSVPPALEGVKWKGRWVILYSKWDIGCALEKHASPECQGHDYESAARLGRAAILYSLTR